MAARMSIFRIGNWSSKAVAVGAILPLLLYSFVVVLGSAMTGFAYKDGHNLSFDQFAETYWKGSFIRLYRTNGGATTAFGVVIRQERTVLPGLLHVRPLDDIYPCSSLDATAVDHGVAISVPGSDCSGLPEQRREYRLKPFLYF